MPTSYATFRTFVGVAKDSINATLSSSIAAAATSLPLQNTVGTTGTLTTSGATYTAIIFDGFLTDTVACSGNLTGGAIACAATANAHSANVYIAFQLTASVGPTDYIPVESFQPIDMIAQLIDATSRGYAAKTFGVQPGMRHGTWDISGAVFPDTFGHILGAHLGADTVTGAGPYTHKFSANNSGTYQPTHYILYDLNGYNTRVFAGTLCSELTITFDPSKLVSYTEKDCVGVGSTPDALASHFEVYETSFDPSKLVSYTSKWLARASGVLPTPTQSFSAIVPVPSWMAVLSLNSAVVGNIKTFAVTSTREDSQVVDTITGNQDPYTIFAGEQECKGKCTSIKQDDGILNYYAGAVPLTQPPISLVLTNGTGASQTGLTVQLTKVAVSNVVTKHKGAPLVEEDFDILGIANSTDGTPGGGQAPAQFQLVNAVSSAGTYV